MAKGRERWLKWDTERKKERSKATAALLLLPSSLPPFSLSPLTLHLCTFLHVIVIRVPDFLLHRHTSLIRPISNQIRPFSSAYFTLPLRFSKCFVMILTSLPGSL
ncbi:hypothetical protein R6Q59_031793 [Mikania micrantha]